MASPVAQGPEGQKLELFEACERGTWRDVERLLRRGASLEWRHPSTGMTPFHYAIKGNNCTLAERILDERKNRGQHNKMLLLMPVNGESAIHLVCRLGHLDLVELVIRRDGLMCGLANRAGDMAIHVACYHGHNAVVKRLLRCPEVEINGGNTRFDTPLHRACDGGHIEVVRTLLAEDVNVNIKNALRLTPLQCAVLDGSWDIADLILEKHPTLNNLDVPGYTALHMACCRHRGIPPPARPAEVAATPSAAEAAEMKTAPPDSSDQAAGTKTADTTSSDGTKGAVESMTAETARPESSEQPADTKAAETASLHVVELAAGINAVQLTDVSIPEQAEGAKTAQTAGPDSSQQAEETKTAETASDDSSELVAATKTAEAASPDNMVQAAETETAQTAGPDGSEKTAGKKTAESASPETSERAAGTKTAQTASPDTWEPASGEETAEEADDWNEEKAAYYEGRVNIIRKLLQAGAKVNTVARDRSTPLCVVSEIGDTQVVRLLLDHGARVQVKDARDPIQVAERSGHQHVVQMLKGYSSD